MYVCMCICICILFVSGSASTRVFHMCFIGAWTAVCVCVCLSVCTYARACMHFGMHMHGTYALFLVEERVKSHRCWVRIEATNVGGFRDHNHPLIFKLAGSLSTYVDSYVLLWIGVDRCSISIKQRGVLYI